MARTLCVWFQAWPLRRSDAPPDSPCQVVGGDHRVVAVNDLARRAGIRPGMRRREAEVRCPEVLTLARDEGAEAAAFEPVAAAVEEVVPRVEVAEPGLLFVAIEGAVRYYGGEEAVARRVSEAVASAAGPGARVAVAGGPFAARWAAATAGEVPRLVADDAAFLGSLDVEVLGREELAATFRWLGITTLGELARLPRGAVASRFGNEGLEAHRLAGGEDRPAIARSLPEDLGVEERFEEPLATLEEGGFAGRALAHRLAARLSALGAAPHRLEVEMESADGVVRRRTWRSADPLDEAEMAERVRWQLRAWVEGVGPAGGLVRLRLVPADLAGGRQLTLGQDVAGEAGVSRAVARAQALLGTDGVLEASPQGGRDPGERVLWHRLDDRPPPPERRPDAPWPGRVPDPAPALVPPGPRPLEVEWDGGLPTRVRLGSRWVEVLDWAGPWRRMGRWWDGEGPADRYQLVTSAGAFLCEVREGRAYLLGVYD